MTFIIIIMMLALAVWIGSAHTKINLLEAQLRQLQAGKVPRAAVHAQDTAQPADVSPIPAPAPAPTSVQSLNRPTTDGLSPMPVPQERQPFAPAPESMAAATQPPQPMAPAQPFFLFEWFKEHTLIKIGSVIFFLGAAWFVTYAFDQNWVPPHLRVLLGLVLGVVVYVLAAARRSASVTQFTVLTALGTAVVFVTVLAAQFSFDAPLLPAAVSLLVLVLAIAYTVYAALATNTQWLATAAAAAVLVAPQFTGGDVTSVVPLLSYLFVAAAGLGVVAMLTTWRYVTLLMTLGCGAYLLAASAAPGQGMTVWWFAIAFSALFLALTSASILRNRVPLLIDGSTLLLVGLLYAYFVDTQATLPGVAMFAAAAVTAGIGYIARLRGADPQAVLLYAVCSVIGLFAGTLYLFDGVTAAIMLAAQSTALIVLAMRYAFLPKTVVMASLTFVVPLFMAIGTLDDAVWDMGLRHMQSLTIAVVAVCLGGLSLYMYKTAHRTELGWLQTLANLSLSTWYLYMLLCIVTISNTLGDVTDVAGVVWATALTLVVSLVLTAMAFLWTNRASLRDVTVWTYVVPVVLSLGILLQAGTVGWFTTSQALVLGLVLAVLTGLTAAYAAAARHNGTLHDSTTWYVLLWVSVLFALLWMTTFIDMLLLEDAALAISAIAATAVLYGVSNLLLRTQVSLGRVVPFVLTLIVPTLALLPSFDSGSWDNSVLSLQAVCLYVHITLLVLLARTLAFDVPGRDEKEAQTISTLTTLLTIGSAGLSIALLWVLAHVVLPTASLAVTVALFIYTIVGLGLYVVGKQRNSQAIVRAGYVLLALVVLRLGLIDVWEMEVFWRIITFLGIGALFIAAAMLERQPDTADTTHSPARHPSESDE